MKINYYFIIAIALVCFGISNRGYSQAQDNIGDNPARNEKSYQTDNNGRVSELILEKGNYGTFWSKLLTHEAKISYDNPDRLIRQVLNLKPEDSFKKLKTKTDQNGVNHHSFQQYYKNTKVLGAEMMIHEYNGNIRFINGTYFEDLDLNTNPSISENSAQARAKNHLTKKTKSTESNSQGFNDRLNGNNFEVNQSELIVMPMAEAKEELYFKLAYIINLNFKKSSYNTTIYVDANNGDILKESDGSLSAGVVDVKFPDQSSTGNFNDDPYKTTTNSQNENIVSTANATGNTFYAGQQNFETSLLDNGKYALRDSSRKINVYDARKKNNLPKNDITDNDNIWNNVLFFKRIQINNLDDSWWSVGESPDPNLYIEITDSLGEVIYKSNVDEVEGYPTRFANNVILDNPPLTLSIYESDFFNLNNDLVFSFTIEDQEGSFIENVGLNNVFYVLENSPNPAIDVLWGLQKTYDYYDNVFNRKSYDGQEKIINAYINVGEQSPNNSFYTPFGSFFGIGLGDGVEYNPIASLDIIAHEFTHGVNPPSLINIGNTRTIYESFSDILGTCIEHSVSGINHDWIMGANSINNGESVIINPNIDPAGVNRSLENPKINGGADTYQGENWFDSQDAEDDDNKRIYKRAGVMNYWFYLLCEGATNEINDNGDIYSVSPIGIDKAEQLVYEVFTNYTFDITGFQSTAIASLFVSNLFVLQGNHGFTQNDIDQIKNAWYAVGVLDDPSNINSCNGIEVLTEESGTVEDGSSGSLYTANLDCRWLIKPPGATSITIDFTVFDLGSGDTVTLYNGESESNILMPPTSGNQLPASYTSNESAVLVLFQTDNAGSADGWELNYTSSSSDLYCDSQLFLNSPSGTFTDGSGTDNYLPNSNCQWLIAPPGATTIDINLTNIDTELNEDEIIIYDGASLSANEIIRFSGSMSDNPVTNVSSTTGEVFVVFNSNSVNQLSGWELSYTSDSVPNCLGLTTLTNATGTISDGSGTDDYQNYLSCSWLIQPPGATSVTLDFNEFDIQPGSSDGQFYYDGLLIFDGSDESSTLIGSYYGSEIPNSITSTSGSIFIKFVTDNDINAQGWSLDYTANYNEFCSGTTILTDVTGSFSDGSGVNSYHENADCRWLIQPENATSIELNFTAFDTETNVDGVLIYEGNSTLTTPIAVYSGNNLPPQIVSNSSSLLVRFVSNEVDANNLGFEANYVANIAPEGNVNAITTYQYWFNDDYSSAVTESNFGAVNTLSLNTIFDSQNLPTGLNVLHFRAKDKLGHWSSIISEFVYIQNVTPGGSNSIVAYEYWLNDDYASKVENTSFNQDLAIINISEYLGGDIDGLNQFHIRFKDERGSWSAVQSEFIYVQNKNLSGSNTITEYEYWFDDDYANKTSVTGITDITFNLNLNNDNSIDKGLHRFHIRFKDSFGNWSSIQSEFIYKTTSNTVNKITSYRYWFNDDFANAVTVNNAPEELFILDDLIDLSSLQADNINYIHFQFKDIAQNWSSVITEEIFTCSSDAGTLTADNGSDILDGPSVNISATPDGNINVPAGYETLFVLTTGTDLVIQDTSTTPDFDVNAVGDYTIHTLVSETSDSSDPNYFDLSAISFGSTTANDVLNIISTNTICADFDVVGAQISVVNCVADAGTLTADEPLVTLTGSSVNISATPDGNINIPTGYETIFVLTTGTDLVIQDTSTTPDFDVSAVGDYTIHTLVAETSDSSDPNYFDLSAITFGSTTANDVLNIISTNVLCADFDVVGAQISVETSMSINDNSISNLMLAFNPVHDYALVLNNSNILIEQIELYDLRGKLLKRLTINTNDKQIVIDTSLYSDSTYIVIIITEVGIFNMKLIKN